MSVLIRGMEMPKSCRKCMISQPDGCGWICPIIESKPIVDGRVNSRPPACPLVPVPPHGRLVDADALMQQIEHDTPLSDVFEKNDEALSAQCSNRHPGRTGRGGRVMNCAGKRCIMQFDKVNPSTCECVSYCPQATPPKTNGDRIRSMSDEELAAWLAGHPVVSMYDGSNPQHKAWLDWLREEAK